MNFRTRKYRIVLIGVASPNHYSQWNVLSCEALAGDLKGFFGESIEVDIWRVDSFDDVAMLPLQNDIVLADLIGFSPSLGSFELLDRIWAELAKAESNRNIKPIKIIGNKVPTYFPEFCLRRYPGSIVVKGESELSLRALVKQIINKSELRDIPNLVYLDEKGNIIQTHLERCDLARLIYTPSTNTVRRIVERGGNVLVQSSRGCPWSSCSYCTCFSFRKEKKWESLPLARVVKNLWELSYLGAREFEFADDEFLGGWSDEQMSRARTIGRTLNEIGSATGDSISFRIFLEPFSIYHVGATKQNLAIENFLLELKSYGLNSVYIGVESGCPSQMGRYRRQGTLSEMVFALRALRRMRIHADVGFIMFDPMLTINELRRNLEFFKNENLIEGNQWPFRPLVVNEGTPIKEELDRLGILGRCKPDFMAYEYEYLDPIVKDIASVIEEISSSTRNLFYALKTKSKMCFLDSRMPKHVPLAKEIVKSNGQIYINLMERLSNDNRTLGWYDSVKEARMSIDGLVKKVRKALELKELTDEDGYIQKELDTLLESDRPQDRSIHYVDFTFLSKMNPAFNTRH